MWFPVFCVLADVLVTSPQKLAILITINIICWLKYPKKKLIWFWKQNHWQLQFILSRAANNKHTSYHKKATHRNDNENPEALTSCKTWLNIWTLLETATDIPWAVNSLQLKWRSIHPGNCLVFLSYILFIESNYPQHINTVQKTVQKQIIVSWQLQWDNKRSCGYDISTNSNPKFNVRKDTTWMSSISDFV